MQKVLQRLQKAGVLLNKDKCIFGVKTVKFLGRIINGNGICIDSDHTETLINLPDPKNIITDHKHLVPLLDGKDLSFVPLQVQRFKMRLMKFTYSISYIPGEEVYIAAVLSRSLLPSSRDEFISEIEACISNVTLLFPASKIRLSELVDSRQQKLVNKILHQFVVEGWQK